MAYMYHQMAKVPTKTFRNDNSTDNDKKHSISIEKAIENWWAAYKEWMNE